MSLLPFIPTLPAALAFLAYLEARTDLTHDLRLLTTHFFSRFKIRLLEKNGKLNPFYQLESNAKNSKLANKTFLIFEGKKYTYKDAYENVLRYGTWLKDRYEVEKDEIVAIDFLNKPSFIWFWFGLLGIGAKVAFLNYNLGGESLVNAVKICKARVVVVDGEVAKDVFLKTEDGGVTMERVMKELSEEEKVESRYLEREVIIFDEGVERVVSTWAFRRADDKDIGGRKIGETGVLIYTSGTTGNPKAANISYSKIVLGTVFLHRYIGISSNDIFYTCMPLYHASAAFLCICTVLYIGCTASLGKKFSHKTFWPEVRESKATVIQYVGETCRYLLSAPPSPLDIQHNVRMAFGNGLRPDVWEKFRERFNIPIIAEFYGVTEGVRASWSYNTGPHGAGAVGRSGTLLKLLSRSLSEIIKLDFQTELPIRDPASGFCIRTKPGERGELLWRLDSSTAYQGYFNNPQATESKILRDVFVKGDAWFRTGDVLLKSEDGYLYFMDRIGDAYRWKSENISPTEIVETLSKFHDGNVFAEIVAYGVSLPGYDGRAGCVAIVPSPKREINQTLFAELSEFVKGNLAGFKIPAFVRVIKERNLDSTGTHKFVTVRLRGEGVEPEKVNPSGDEVWYWTGREEGYKRMGKREWDDIVAGRVKL